MNAALAAEGQEGVVVPAQVPLHLGYSSKGGAVAGGCSGWGWYYIVKLIHNITYITTPCFHCTPLCGM